MKVFTAEQVEDRAKYLDREQRHESAAMLRELAKRLRQDAAEHKRNPAVSPAFGDMLVCSGTVRRVFCGGALGVFSEEDWAAGIKALGATAVRRGEVV